MKKDTLFLLITSMLTLSACSTIDTTETQAEKESSTIKFSAPFIQNTTTRSATGDIAGVNELKDYGVKVWGEMYESATYDANSATAAFDNGGYRTLRWDSSSSSWTYDDVMYWTKGKNYDFVGFAPAEEANVATYENGLIKVSNIPVVQTIDNSMENKSGIDYLLSNVTTSIDNGSTRDDVCLVFKHLLSRLSVYVWTDNLICQGVVLKSLEFFLPNDDAKANYEEANHNGPASGSDVWTWTGFTDVPNALSEESLAGYSRNTLNTTNVDVPACSDKQMAESDAKLLDSEFFIAPTPNDEDITLYVKATYDIIDESRTVETTKFTQVTSLKKLKQGYQHNIYICLNDQKMTFTVSDVEGWNTENYNNATQEIDNIAGHEYGFNAVQDNFELTGTIKVNTFGDVSFSSAQLALQGSSTSSDVDLNVEGWYKNADCNGTASDEATAESCYAKFRATPDPMVLNGSGTYTLTLTNQNGDKNSTDVDIDVSEMAFTIETQETDVTFSVPMATGATPAPMAIVWGDGSMSNIMENSIVSSDLQHTYAASGTYKIRIMTLQTDDTAKQINEFNFGKYPTSTLDISDYTSPSYSANDNGQMLRSIDTAVLNTGTDDLSSMFYNTGIVSISPDCFKLFSNVKKLDATFAKCESLTNIPTGLFSGMDNVETMYATFRQCTSLTTVPDDLLADITNVKTMYGMMRECSALEELPAGFFSRQQLCCNYIQLLGLCSNLCLNTDLFIDPDNGITTDNRFTQCTELVRIDNIFWGAGSSRTTNIGSIPDLWNYQYSNKYGYIVTYNPVNDNTKYVNRTSIPTYWTSADTSTAPDYFQLLTNQ
ncbi:MAG: fimbrillin family protein [Prevotella sp.]